MSRPIRAVTNGTGMAAPELIITNSDLEKLVDTSDQFPAPEFVKEGNSKLVFPVLILQKKQPGKLLKGLRSCPCRGNGGDQLQQQR